MSRGRSLGHGEERRAGTGAGGPAPELSVVIPTRDREAILLETLATLERQANGLPVEVVVVVDGSSDGSAGAGRALSGRSPLRLRVLDQAALGPASARNRALTAARGTACLFLGDDIRPRAGLIERHLEFHRRHPDPGSALLGLVVPAPPLDQSPFIRWLHERGVQFGFASLSPDDPVRPEHLWTSNASVKTELLRAVGGFDEAFTAAACEDAELGLRLAGAGMTLRFDPAAIGEHYHPTDLAATLLRMRTVGHAFQRLHARVPELPMPRRPGLRHRLKATALTVLNLARPRPSWVRHATWRFLCDEVQREAFWDTAGRGKEPRIGGLLARVAERDPATKAPTVTEGAC